MADADFDDFDAYGYDSEPVRATAEPPARFQGWVNAAGALTSVALVAGLGVWGYNLAVRDVTGIPVIRALEGPARVAPENPGGELAVHQGMAVNEIAADGTAAAAADRLTLAPRTEGLADEDEAMGRMSPGLDGAVPPASSDFAGVVTPPAAPLGESDPTLAGIQPTEPLPDGPADPMLDEALTGADAVAISADVPGVASSPRPPFRGASPAAVAMVAPETPTAASDSAVDAMAEAAAAAVAEAMAPQDLDVTASALPAGTRLVQIGAYPKESDARLQWEKTSQRFGALFDGKQRVIEEASSGGSVFYRLRVAGFTDFDDAQRFCSALKAEGAECVPAVVR